jgi:hypothetical protein
MLNVVTWWNRFVTYLHPPNLVSNATSIQGRASEMPERTLMNCGQKYDIIRSGFAAGTATDYGGGRGVLSLLDITECSLPETLRTAGLPDASKYMMTSRKIPLRRV